MQEALKTWRKRNAAMLLATQAIDDFASADLLRTVVESCPTKLLLANPALDRAQYAELFQLNDDRARPADRSDAPAPDPAQAARSREGPQPDGRSPVVLALHEHADRQRARSAIFREYGFEAGLDRLAASA